MGNIQEQVAAIFLKKFRPLHWYSKEDIVKPELPSDFINEVTSKRNNGFIRQLDCSGKRYWSGASMLNWAWTKGFLTESTLPIETQYIYPDLFAKHLEVPPSDFHKLKSKDKEVPFIQQINKRGAPDLAIDISQLHLYKLPVLDRRHSSNKTNNELFEQFIQSGRKQVYREMLVERYYPFVKRIAMKLFERLPSSVNLENLISDGAVGLMNALKRYNPKSSNKFETYASFRIKGAMLTSLREQDILTRRERKNSNAYESFCYDFEDKHMRKPDSCEIMKGLNISFNRLLYLERLNHTHIFEFDSDEYHADTLVDLIFGPQQEKDVLKKEGYHTLMTACDKLGQQFPRQRMVIDRYYFRELTMKETGATMGITGCTVSYHHRLAIKNLRKYMGVEVRDQ